MKQILTISVLLILYHLFSSLMLFHSKYWNVIGYFFWPPHLYWDVDDIHLERLPMFFSDELSWLILSLRSEEIKLLVKNNELDYTSILTIPIDTEDKYNKIEPLRKKSEKFALMMKELGIPLNSVSCELAGKNTRDLLVNWDRYDEEIEKFLNKYFKAEQHNKCED